MWFPPSGLFGRWAKYGACGRRVLASDFTPSFPTHLLLSSAFSFFVILLLFPRMPQAGSHRQARTPPRAGPGSPAPRPARSNTPTRRPLDPGMPGCPEYLRGPWGATERAGKSLVNGSFSLAAGVSGRKAGNHKATSRDVECRLRG